MPGSWRLLLEEGPRFKPPNCDGLRSAVHRVLTSSAEMYVRNVAHVEALRIRQFLTLQSMHEIRDLVYSTTR